MARARQPRGTRSAQEYTLNTPQLLGLILANLVLWPEELTNAALVCKEWKQVALQTKWGRCKVRLRRILEKLDPNVKINRKDRVATFSFNTVDQNGELKDRWRKWQYAYSVRVSRLEVDCVFKPETISLLKELLVDSHWGPPLCPSTTHLYVSPMNTRPDDEEDEDEDEEEEEDGPVPDAKPDLWSQTLDFLSTPRLLKSFYICQNDSSDAQMNLYIHTIARNAPGIRSVEVLTPAFTPDFAAFTNMRHFSLNGHLDHKGWKLLARCEHLESIELWEAGEGDGEGQEEEEPEEYSMVLPNLKHILIEDPDEARSPSLIEAIFKNTTMPMLESVELHCNPDVDKDAIRGWVQKGRSLPQPVRLKFGYGNDDED